jgi:hypothetical protein
LSGVATVLFALAAYGTLAFPVVIAGVLWRTPPGGRGHRALLAAGWWSAFCAAAAAGRLATEDGYYSPNHVTYWSHMSDGERLTMVVLLGVAASLALTALLAARRARRGPATALLLTAAAWLADVIMLVYSVGLGLH